MVALEAGGVRVYAATGSDSSTRGVSFRQNVTGGDVQSGYVGARSSLNASTQYWKALGATGQDAALHLEAVGGRANARQSEGRLSFEATGYTGGTAKTAQMSLVGRADGKSAIYCEPAGGFFGIGEGGLMVGACGETTDVPAGEIWADGGFSSDAGVTVVRAGQNSAVAVKVTQNWTTNARVFADVVAAGLAMPTSYGGLFDAFSADPLWFCLAGSLFRRRCLRV